MEHKNYFENHPVCRKSEIDWSCRLSVDERLAKYMLPSGYYNTRAIREDEGMDKHSAFWFDFFGDNEGEPEEKGELLKAAEAFNDKKENDDRQAALEANTAESIIEHAKTYEPGSEAEREFSNRLSNMKEDERKKLVRAWLAELDKPNASWNDAAYKNRILRALVNMHLGEEYGDVADQTGGVNYAKALKYVNDQSIKQEGETQYSDQVGIEEHPGSL